MTIVKYLNPKNDIAFKKIFGSEKNKDILIHFLNDVLNKTGKAAVKTVTLLNPIQQPELLYRKQSVVDVLCTDESGIQYIVEMQVSRVKGFEKRAQYYASKAYCNQMREGGAYENLKEIIFLAIANYVMFPEKGGYKSDHIILDKNSYEHDLKDFYFTFIELPKFTKELKELKTYEEKWCYFFKHAHEPENIEKLIADSDEVIKKAYRVLETHNWTDEELRAYEAVEKSTLDAIARESYIVEEAQKTGFEKGMTKGKAEGKAEGESQRNIEIAKKMLAKKKPVEEIAEFTGLTEKEINSLGS
jgi:predicted transposase/invertase (TIGR01784 family)